MGSAPQGGRPDPLLPLRRRPLGAPLRQFASTSPPRRCTGWAFPPPGRSASWGAICRWSGRRWKPPPPSSGSRRATYASAPFEYFAARGAADRVQRARRLRHRRATSRSAGGDRRCAACSAKSCRRTGRADGAVDGGGLCPWRHEHRQHVDPRPHARLRPLRVSRRLRCRLHLQPHRHRRAATRSTSSPRSGCGTAPGSARR